MSRLFSISRPAFSSNFQSMASCMLFCLFLAPISAVANDKPVHDPFEKPGVLLPGREGGNSSSSVNNFLTNAHLTATLQAGRNSMVIVDGRSIRLGEEIDGHRLIKVQEGSAVFTKNKQRLILKIDRADETN